MRRLFYMLPSGGLVCIAGSAQAQTKITIGYAGANAFLPAFVAKEKGYFEKRGLDVTMKLVPVGSTIPAVIVSGSLTFGASN